MFFFVTPPRPFIASVADAKSAMLTAGFPAFGTCLRHNSRWWPSAFFDSRFLQITSFTKTFCRMRANRFFATQTKFKSFRPFPNKGVMKNGMRPGSHQNQIGKFIISFVSINVVHHKIGGGLRQNAMFPWPMTNFFLCFNCNVSTRFKAFMSDWVSHLIVLQGGENASCH